MTEVRFLGWEAPFLHRAADWLVERYGADMGGVVVAVPGRRAAHRLEELLVKKLVPGDTPFEPPQYTTAGRLTDHLLLQDAPTAGGFLRTLAWATALRSCSATELKVLSPASQFSDDFKTWWVMAQELRSLHGELGGEDFGFDGVSEELKKNAPNSERDRWKVLVKLQHAYRKQLDLVRLSDPHDARRDAVKSKQVDQEVAIVLVGVTDVNGLLRATLDQLPGAVTALVCAPSELSDHFDGLGCVERERWPGFHVPMEKACWRVAQNPAGQAHEAVGALEELGGQLSPSEISLGIPDVNVVPFLERQLSAHGVKTRRAAGVSVASSSVVTLLRRVSKEVQQQDFSASSSLLRHPDIERRLAGDLSEPEEDVADFSPATACDAFASEHIPRSRRLSVELRDEKRAPEVGRMASVHDALERLLGELGKATTETRPVSDWAPVIAAFLARVYSERSWNEETLDDAPQEERLCVAALRIVGERLRELRAVPPKLGQQMPVTIGIALDLVVEEFESELLPEPVTSDAVELVGWLDLAHDDSKAVVLTGFNEGVLPESIRTSVFLPEALRTRMGLPDDALRIARDLHGLASILHSGRKVTLISGRRGLRGDPLQPSRLAFHVPDEAMLERVRLWLPADEEGRQLPPESAVVPTARSLPMAKELEPPSALAVTAFREYLASPYRFYLQRMLRLKSIEGEVREMDPMVFGQVAHKVLERFGREKLRNSEDPEKIFESLVRLLSDESLRRFGHKPLPAVRIQIRRLQLRLHAFAQWQAQWRAKGWRIHQVEWSPDESSVSLTVDDLSLRLRGRIDRVDRNDLTGEWAVIDYKTGEQGSGPRQTHGPSEAGVWKDLQMPLYRLLVQPLLNAAAEADQDSSGTNPVVKLGYVPLSRKPSSTKFIDGKWTAEELDSGLECAQEVVRAIRAGRFESLGDFPDGERDRVFAAIAGRGLLSGEASEDSEGEE